MFCKQCGNRLAENTKFCGICGESANTATAETKQSYKVIPRIDEYMPQEKPSVFQNIVLQIFLLVAAIAIATLLSSLIRRI